MNSSSTAPSGTSTVTSAARAQLTPSGGRYWRLKYRHGGKEKRLAFGVYPAVTLREARERREEARKVLERGDDPVAVKKAAKVRAVFDAGNTFAELDDSLSAP